MYSYTYAHIAMSHRLHTTIEQTKALPDAEGSKVISVVLYPNQSTMVWCAFVFKCN